MSKNREVCAKSLAFPKTVTVSSSSGIKTKTFEDSEVEKNRYFDYLETDEATYIWRDSADMIAIATYFNISIEDGQVLYQL